MLKKSTYKTMALSIGMLMLGSIALSPQAAETEIKGVYNREPISQTKKVGNFKRKTKYTFSKKKEIFKKKAIEIFKNYWLDGVYMVTELGLFTIACKAISELKTTRGDLDRAKSTIREGEFKVEFADNVIEMLNYMMKDTVLYLAYIDHIEGTDTDYSWLPEGDLRNYVDEKIRTIEDISEVKKKATALASLLREGGYKDYYRAVFLQYLEFNHVDNPEEKLSRLNRLLECPG